MSGGDREWQYSPLTGEHTDRWMPMHSEERMFLLEKPGWFLTPCIPVAADWESS